MTLKTKEVTMDTDKKYVKLDDENFEREVLASSEPVLVDFWADWCQPCHVMAPAVEALASEFEGSAKVGKLDVEELPALAERFAIHSIPSLLFFKDGKEVDRVTGVVSKEVLAEKLTALVRKRAVVS